MFVDEDEFSRAVPADADNLVQAGLVDGRVLRVPAPNARFVLVDDGHPNVGILKSNHCRSWATWETEFG